MSDEGSKPRRCTFCQHDQGLVAVKNVNPETHPGMVGTVVCRNSIACNARMRKRLGIPAYQIKILRARELAQAKAKLGGSNG